MLNFRINRLNRTYFYFKRSYSKIDAVFTGWLAG